jgi:hypothetical protein
MEQLPTAQSASLLKHEKLIEKFGNFALGGFGVVILFGVTILIYTIIEKFLITGQTFICDSSDSVHYIRLFSLVFVFFNESFERKKSENQSGDLNELDQIKRIRRNFSKTKCSNPFRA